MVLEEQYLMVNIREQSMMLQFCRKPKERELEKSSCKSSWIDYQTVISFFTQHLEWKVFIKILDSDL